MRRVGLVGLCFVVAACGVAIAATGASALEPPEIGRCVAHKSGKFANSKCTKEPLPGAVGKFEWEPGAVKKKFTGVGGLGTLETVGKAKVTCETENSTGEITSPKAVGNIEVIFHGCQTAGFICTSPGSVEGELVTNLLSGTLQWENALKTKVAVDLVPQSTELFIEFQCGPVPVKVKGSVMSNIASDTVKTVFEEKFVAKAGKQKPEFYFTNSGEKVKDVLISKIGGENAKFEQAGQTIINKQTDEEPLEVNRLF